MIESQGVLILEKKDFVIEAREKEIEELTAYDIAGSINPYKHASMVIIVDEGKMKIIKSKYPLRDEEHC